MLRINRHKAVNLHHQNQIILKFTFPEVEGWTNSEVMKTPVGDMVNYDSEEGGRVTLYFYRRYVEGPSNKKPGKYYEG